MRKASDLTHQELVELVNQVLFHFYGSTAAEVEDQESVRDLDGDTTVLNPDFMATDDNLDDVCGVLRSYDLVGDEVTVWPLGAGWSA